MDSYIFTGKVTTCVLISSKAQKIVVFWQWIGGISDVHSVVIGAAMKIDVVSMKVVDINTLAPSHHVQCDLNIR